MALHELQGMHADILTMPKWKAVRHLNKLTTSCLHVVM